MVVCLYYSAVSNSWVVGNRRLEGGQAGSLSLQYIPLLLAPFVGSWPVGRDVDVVDGTQGGVQHAAADAVVDLF